MGSVGCNTQVHVINNKKAAGLVEMKFDKNNSVCSAQIVWC